MNNRKPIDSAPKNGTEVLLWDCGVEIGIWVNGVHSWNDGDWWIEGGQITGHPTHWMPLPDGPNNG